MVPGPLLLQTTTSPPTQSPHDGGPRSFPIPRRHISTVPRLPLGHCPPLDHNLQPQRHLLLLLPLGQATLFSPISRSPPPYTLPHPIPTLHGNFHQKEKITLFKPFHTCNIILISILISWSQVKQNKGQSLPVLMPGDELPKFIAMPCPRQPSRPDTILVAVENPPLKPPLPVVPFC